MLSPKVILVFFAILAYTQGETTNTCANNGIDLCAVLKSLASLEVEIDILALIIKLQNLLGSVISTMVCNLGIQVCVPVCTLVQALMELNIEVNIINSIFVSVTGEPPECNI
uniref:Putative secreted protein n=1 Tax=Xenopsylla cheopis TaxID=163159 RepID=A0A6M2DY30_XENCH